MHYYNEFDASSAAMLRQMIKDGLLPEGVVDERPIQEIKPDDLKEYTQCHFFAGIGGWQYALQLAEWPADRAVWTGSCPCQPFSSAGRQEGKNDDRHLWPVWMRLIAECRPPAIYGEQVATAVAHGWLDDVYQGLEAEGYAVGAVVLPASAVGAPHKRDRLWFVGHAEKQRPRELSNGEGAQGRGASVHSQSNERGNSYGNVANAECERLQGGEQYSKDKNGDRAKTEQPCVPATQPRNGNDSLHWGQAHWINCPDGKARLVEPSVPLLAHGVQHRKPILHAIGNAIVPQAGAEIIRATM